MNRGMCCRQPMPTSKPMPSPEQRKESSIRPVPDLLLTSDILRLIFGHANGRTVSTARRVCSAWRTVSTELQHGRPLLTHGVLVPLLIYLPTFADLARAAAVCTLWKCAARAEQGHWRDAVREQARRQVIPQSVSSVSLVDKAVLIAARFGLDPLSSGGVNRCVRLAFAALDLGDVTAGAGRGAFIASPAEFTLIAQPSGFPPTHGATQSAEGFSYETRFGSSLVMIACLERVSAQAVHLVDLLATALLLLPPSSSDHGSDDDDDDDETRSEYTVESSHEGDEGAVE